MASDPRVTDDDDSRYVFEGFGPASRAASAGRRQVQTFMQRLVRDVLDHPEDYGALRDPLVLLAENYARTCASRAELQRRMEHDAALLDERGAAAVLVRRVWRAQASAERTVGNGHNV